MHKKITYNILVLIFEIVFIFLQIFVNGNAMTIWQAGIWLLSIIVLGGYLVRLIFKEALCFIPTNGRVYQYSKKAKALVFIEIFVLIVILLFCSISMKLFYDKFHSGALVITISLMVLENVIRTTFYLQQRKEKTINICDFDYTKNAKIKSISCTEEEASNFAFTVCYSIAIMFLGLFPMFAIVGSTVKGLLVFSFVTLVLEILLLKPCYTKLFAKAKEYKDLYKKLKLSLILDLIINILTLTLIILLCFNLESEIIRCLIFAISMSNYLQKIIFNLHQTAKTSAGMKKFLQESRQELMQVFTPEYVQMYEQEHEQEYDFFDFKN